MKQLVCAIVCEVPERISVYTECLRTLTTHFIFRSSVRSLLQSGVPSNLGLVIIDNFDGRPGLADVIHKVRSEGGLPSQVLIVVSGQEGCETGIRALEAGANDYLSFGAVHKELLTRARLYLPSENQPVVLEPEAEALLATIRSPEDNVLLRTALKCIEKDIGAIKSVHDLSLCCGHPAHVLNKVFQKYFEMTVFQYLRQKRIDEALHMLRHTQVSITEIALTLGYSTAPNFATAFKQAVGTSPSQYRLSNFERF